MLLFMLIWPGRLNSKPFKKAAPLAFGPAFGPSVEFWVQLSYPQKLNQRSNQSHYSTWHSNKSPPHNWFQVLHVIQVVVEFVGL